MNTITFEDIARSSGSNLVDWFKLHNQKPEDFYCRSCGKFMLDLDDLKDVSYNLRMNTYPMKLYRGKKNVHYVESDANRWLVWGRKLSDKVYFRRICWDCFFMMLPEIEDIPKRARKSSWYKDVLNGVFRPPAAWTSPSKYFMTLFDITQEELEAEHQKFDTASLESFKRRHGEKAGAEKYDEYRKRQAYTCSKEYMMGEKGMTEDEWNMYNANRACTRENFISRYGDELGRKKWDEYCELESYVRCKREYFVEKYGEEEGVRKYLEVNKQKAQTLDNYVRKYGYAEGRRKFESVNSLQYSEISQEMFRKIQSSLGIFGMNAKFGANESPVVVNFNDGTVKNCYPDYILNTKIIEFNGDYWHMNPRKYSADDRITFADNWRLRYHGDTASAVWEYDKEKIQAYERLGYKVKVVWECDYKANPDAVVAECVDFLKS